MSTSTLTRDALPTTTCRLCPARVVLTVDRSGMRKVLDAHRVPGGIYELDARGKARRRPLTVVTAELRDQAAGQLNVTRGYAVHDCPGAPRSRWT